jgi:predicted PurR-regulated permease PerM
MHKDSLSSIRSEKRFRVMFLILFLIVFIAICYIFRYIFWPLLFAFVFYVALKPIHDLVSRYIKTKWLVTLLIILMFVLLIIIPFFFLLYSFADQTFEFYQIIARKFMRVNIDEYIYGDDKVRFILKSLKITRTEIIQKFMEFLQTSSFNIFASITGMVKISLSFFINFMFMILMIFAMFTDGKRLANVVYDVVPFPKEIEKVIFRRIRDVIKILVVGNIAVMTMQGTAVGIGFAVFGVGMPILGGAFAAILSLIPVIGTSVVWLPAVIYYIIIGKYLIAGILAAWCLFWYLFLENFIKPKFFGSKLKFHPLVFFFLLIGSIGVFNLPGIIVGPILLTIFFSLWEIYSLLYLEKNEEMTESTETAIKKMLKSSDKAP